MIRNLKNGTNLFNPKRKCQKLVQNWQNSNKF